MWYTGTTQQCNDYNDMVTLNENYQGLTTQWDEVINHPTITDLSAINKNNVYPSELMDEIETLPEDWYN